MRVLREFQTEINLTKIFLFVVTAEISLPCGQSPSMSPTLRQYKLIQVMFPSHISKTNIQPPTRRNLRFKYNVTCYLRSQPIRGSLLGNSFVNTQQYWSRY
jgi:hypothetical protein